MTYHKHLCPFNRTKPEGPRGKHWHTTSGLGFFHTVDGAFPEPPIVIHLAVTVEDGIKTTKVTDVAVNFMLAGEWQDLERLQKILTKVKEEGRMTTRRAVRETK